jgi:hypothetical protein
MTPSEQQRRSVDGYFAQHGHYHVDLQLAEQEDESSSSYVAGPDFVSLDEKLEVVETDTTQEDEAHVRRLVKNGGAGAGTWFGNVLGWGLFSVEENEEEELDGEGYGEATEGEDEVNDEASGLSAQGKRRSTARQFEGVTSVDERIPPPKADEGGWQDAAWLLTVASKVLL